MGGGEDAGGSEEGGGRTGEGGSLILVLPLILDERVPRPLLAVRHAESNRNIVWVNTTWNINYTTLKKKKTDLHNDGEHASMHTEVMITVY